MTTRLQKEFLGSKYFNIRRFVSFSGDLVPTVGYSMFLGEHVDRLWVEEDFKKTTGKNLWDELYKSLEDLESDSSLSVVNGSFYIHVNVNHVKLYNELIEREKELVRNGGVVDMEVNMEVEMDVLRKGIEERDSEIVGLIILRLDPKFKECCGERVPSLKQTIKWKLEKDYVFCMKSVAWYCDGMGGGVGVGGGVGRVLASIDLVSEICGGVL